MARKTENHPASVPGAKAPKASAAQRGSRIVRQIAQGTILAAGLAATQFGIPEIDPRFHLFDRTLVDRLQEPISRHHE
jgi:hypothetical protein